nr:uridine diphosphate glucose pyrophosphatase NUDT14-like [Procambarus clarkii]
MEAATEAPEEANHQGLEYQWSVVRPRKKKYKSSRPSTSHMVHDAINKIGSEEKGASVQKIKKYIYANYKVDIKKIDVYINRYIKKAIKDGELINSTRLRSGAIGFFKIAAKPKPAEHRRSGGAEHRRVRTPAEEGRGAPGRLSALQDPKQEKGPPPSSSVTAVMDLIDEVSLQPLTTSQFVTPYRMTYRQNDVEKIWDLVSLHESVSIIIFNSDRKKIVLVRQFRPAVYYSGIAPEDRGRSTVDTVKYPGIRGLTLEFCAGIVDKSKNLVEIAREEVLEECGYDVPVEKFEQVITYRSGVGVSGDRQTMFYVDVTDAMKVSDGGGIADEGEMIEVVEMSITELRVFLNQPEVNCPGGLLFGLMWFLQHKAPKD